MISMTPSETPILFSSHHHLTYPHTIPCSQISHSPMASFHEVHTPSRPAVQHNHRAVYDVRGEIAASTSCSTLPSADPLSFCTPP